MLSKQEEVIKETIKEIKRLEENQLEACSILRKHSLDFSEPGIIEKQISFEVKEKKINERIVGVDSSFVSQELQGADLLLIRGVAAVFDYEETKLRKHSYFPSSFPPYEIYVKTSLEAHEFQWSKSILRLKNEVSIAIACIKKFSPSCVMLDGSIVPHVSDRPSKDSVVFEGYLELVEKFIELYKTAIENNCMLLGIIKDSRGKHFVDLIKRYSRELRECSTLDFTNDTSFLTLFLKEGERTFSFNYATPLRENQIMRDLKEFSERICAFYMKPVKYDRAIRIDFLNPCENRSEASKYVDSIASLVYSLSKQNNKYGYPAVLIEADLRALLDEGEVENVFDRLFGALGGNASMLKLRRDLRPFR